MLHRHCQNMAKVTWRFGARPFHAHFASNLQVNYQSHQSWASEDLHLNNLQKSDERNPTWSSFLRKLCLNVHDSGQVCRIQGKKCGNLRSFTNSSWGWYFHSQSASLPLDWNGLLEGQALVQAKSHSRQTNVESDIQAWVSWLLLSACFKTRLLKLCRWPGSKAEIPFISM